MIYNLGQIAAFPFCGLLADAFGRKICVFVGYLIVLISTAVQGSCHTLSVFMGGRFILGFGAALASAAGPAYTVEPAPPH
jgi:MFS family permease